MKDINRVLSDFEMSVGLIREEKGAPSSLLMTMTFKKLFRTLI